MIKKLYAIWVMVFVSVLAGSAYADEPIYTGMLTDEAVSGYDTVAYFTDGKAVKGKEAFKFNFKGAEWRFASQANMEAFKAEPEKYMPQYGGYCAWAMARGHTAASNPEFWSIIDGKLYLNYNAEVKMKWEKQTPMFIKDADKKYPEVVDLEE